MMQAPVPVSRNLSLGAVFLSILAALEPGCSGGSCRDFEYSGHLTDAEINAVAKGNVLTSEECLQLCAPFVESDTGWGDTGVSDDWSCKVQGSAGAYQVYCGYEWCGGGRGHARVAVSAFAARSDAVADWLARMAQAEEGSVVAFELLAEELRGLGAPETLLRRVRRAAADERRHGRTMRGLARARGVEAPQLRCRPGGARPLLAFAVENAVEGRVRETWGALEAHHQARAAEDPRIRRAMARIAVDETRHAELATDLQRWALARLAPGEREQVARAEADAWAALRSSLTREQDPELLRQAGLPDAGRAVAMLTALIERGVLAHVA